MDIAIAQKRIDDLVAAMLVKGMREPNGVIRIIANDETRVHLSWKKGTPHGRDWFSDEQVKIFRGLLKETLEEAAAFIAEQPDPEQAQLNEFLSVLGKAVELGKKYGIDADYLNPLVASMKKLSANIITDQRAA